jgi:ADP-ribose pyrophosphatase YjhB (NUDIX family)
LLDEVRAIAAVGLAYAENPFDRERYEHLLELAAHEYASVARLPDDEVLERFRSELGYVTTKVGTEAAIIDESERMLLVRRVDDGTWGIISGWVDPGETPASTIVREIHEETGFEAVIDEMVGISARPACAEYGPHAQISVLHLCSIVGGEASPQAHEVLELAWRDIDTVDNWHKNHEVYARAALARWRQRHAESLA